ncbi:hypothetical protein [Micromonospora sp. NPDC048839]|uniref:hypothetical protein n=1 Tax=Micromonospora sp. NPDC048839 TaxID=3155641 RepID=UPI0033C4B913
MTDSGSRDAEIRDLVASTAMLGRVSGHELLSRWPVAGGRWPVAAPVRLAGRAPAGRAVAGHPHERIGWRMRAANLRGHDPDDASVRDEFVFEADYQICHRCRIGWVEQPHALPAYRRRGLAAAGLAALRRENACYDWHTLGGYIDGSPAFWDTIGADVPGGYRPRRVRAGRRRWLNGQDVTTAPEDVDSR